MVFFPPPNPFPSFYLTYIFIPGGLLLGVGSVARQIACLWESREIAEGELHREGREGKRGEI